MSLPPNSPLHAAVGRLVEAAEISDPLRRLESLLQTLTSDLHAAGGLVHEEEEDEVLLHAAPNLTIYHITLSPGLHYPAHNHLMDALIGIYRGSETDFSYPVDAGRLGAPRRRDLIAPAVVHLPAQAVHSVANMGKVRSGALHVYLGDLTHIERQLWSPQNGQAERFDNDRYLAGARPIATSD